MARAHGNGTLIKRGNTYQARWMVKGKLYTRSTGCSTKEAAQKKLEEFTKPFRENSTIEVLENLTAKVRVAEGILKDTKNKSAPPIKLMFLVDVYKGDVNTGLIKSGTESHYESIVNVFREFVKKEYAHEITKEDVERYLTYMKQKVGPSRYNGSLNSLRHMFEVAMKHDYRIRVNPFDGFVRMKGDKLRTRRELTTDEVKTLCKVANERSPELSMLFELGAYTGLRCSDCMRLKWSNIDFNKKLITITPVKTERSGLQARIPLHPKLQEKLSKWPHEGDRILVKLNKIGRTNLNSQIAAVFSLSKIKTHMHDSSGRLKITTGFHALRHYFISQCVKEGIPISVVQKMVAHTSADMSLAYTHTFDSDLHLPDFDGEYEKIILKKTTVEALNKAKGVYELDDFIMSLLKGNTTSITHIKTKSDIELDEMLDELIPDK